MNEYPILLIGGDAVFLHEEEKEPEQMTWDSDYL